MPTCIKCKAEIPEGSTFCNICGKKQTAQSRKRRKRANGSGTIYKMSGNRSAPYGIRRGGIYLGSARTYAEAQKILERATDLDINDKYNLTFAQVYERWKPVHAREVKSMDTYKSAFKACPELHGQRFRDLRKSDFQAVVLRLEQEGKSKSTCEKMLQLFGQLSTWALDECIVNQNHARNVTTTALQKSVRQPFPDLTIKAIQKSKSPVAEIVMILIATGARPGELFSAPLVNCHDNYFIGGSKTEAGQNRVIPVAPLGLPAYTALRRRAMESHCAYLIDAYKGNRTVANFTKRDFKTFMAELGCEGYTTYNCRHTFATLAVRAGVPQHQLMQIIGHVDAKTTDLYTHMGAEDLVAAVARIVAKAPDRADNLLTSKKVN